MPLTVLKTSNETAFRRTMPRSPVWPGYWIYHYRNDSISFGTEERDYFGWLPAEILATS